MHASWPDHATIALARCPLGRDHGSFSNSHRPSSEGTFRVDAPDQFLFTRWIEAKSQKVYDVELSRLEQRKISKGLTDETPDGPRLRQRKLQHDLVELAEPSGFFLAERHLQTGEKIA